MGTSRVWLAIGLLAASVTAATAQPQPKPKPPDEIDMEGDPPTPDPAKPAPAPNPAKDPKLAVRLAAAAATAGQKADALARQNRADEARALYESAAIGYSQAIEAGDDVNLYYDLAGIEEKLARWIDAARHYRTVIQATNAKPEIVQQAGPRLDGVMSKLAVVKLAVKPEGATVTLDGRELGKSPLSEPLVLLPGSYKLEIVADGYKQSELELALDAGSESERTVELESIPVTFEKPPDKPIERPIDQPRPPAKTVLFAAGGAALALAVTSTITGLLAVGEHSKFTAGDSSASERTAARDSGKRLALVSDVCLIGALGAAGFTVYWYVAKFRPAQAGFADKAKVAVTPWVQPGSSGLAVGGTF